MSVKIEFNRQSLRLPDYDYSAEGSYFITACTDQHMFHFGAIFNDQMLLNEIGIIAKNEWFKLPNRFPFIHLGPFCVMPNHIHGIINVTYVNSSSISSASPSSSFSFDGFISVGAGLAPAHEPTANNGEIIGSTADNGEINVLSIRAGASPALTEESNQEKKEKKEKVTLGNKVGAYKSLVMKACLAEHTAKYALGLVVPALGKIWQRNYYEHIIRTQQSYDSISAYITTNPQNWTKDKFYLKF